MKYLRIFLILLLIPFIVLAEECDISKITITSLEQASIEGNTEVVEEPTFQDRSINLNLKMYDANDSITYDLVIKNDSEEDYMIDEDTFKTDSDYIEYTLKTKDNTNVVKANSTKEVSLIVTYKKEIEDDKLTNNKFNASNKLKLSLNTNEKEQPLDTITTDNIKEVKNPVTSVSSMMLISIILLTSIVILYILIKRRNKYTKYLLILVSMILIPTVYAICKCDIEVDSTIEIEKVPKIYDIVADLSKEENACVTKYEGDVTDEVGKTVSATNVYFDKCTEQRNIIFGGFCWQVIRTTETGGIKIIYNGEPVDGKCESERVNHKGIVQTNNTTQNQDLSSSYLYGNSFTYDTTTKTFTLLDTTTAIWNDSTYKELIGKFTCKNTTGTCTLLHSINGYKSNTTASTSYYAVSDTNYADIGSSTFNANYYSLAMVGYMFNKVYDYQNPNSPTSGSLMGNDVSYSNGTYTLLPASGESELGTTIDNSHHYTCNNTTGTCNKVRYYYYSGFYIELDGGEKIDDAIANMLYADNVNRYNSSIKGIIDAWYAQNLSSKTDMIENAIYCNDRNIINLENNGWNKNGAKNIYAYFSNYIRNNNLACHNISDQFSVSNEKAKLTYPVGLIQVEEVNNISNPLLMATGKQYWTISPFYFYQSFAGFAFVKNNGIADGTYNSGGKGIRPIISLKNNSIVTSGTGSEEEPWIIK